MPEALSNPAMSQTMREALRELLAAYKAPYPSAEQGQAAQDAWSARRARAEQNAEALLSAPSSEQAQQGAAIDRDEQTTQWVADGGFFHRFGGEDHACMPLSAWRASRPAAAAPTRWAMCPETETPCSYCPTNRVPCEAGVTDGQEAMAAAYMRFCKNRAPDHNEVGFPYFKAAWQDRAALAGAAQPRPLLQVSEKHAMKGGRWTSSDDVERLARDLHRAIHPDTAPPVVCLLTDVVSEVVKRLKAGAAQSAPAILPAQASEALDELEASALGDEPYNHFAGAVVRRYLEQAGAAQGEDPVAEVTHSKPDNYSANHRIKWLTKDALPVGTKLCVCQQPPAAQDAGVADALAKHLRDAHAFIENTDAFGRTASHGILDCGGCIWNVDESKAALARHEAGAAQGAEPTDEQIADAIESEFSATGEWPEGDAATVRAALKHLPRVMSYAASPQPPTGTEKKA